MFNIEPLGRLAKAHPAIARLLEGVVGAILIEALYYLLSVVVEGVTFDPKTMVATALLPLYMSLSKYRRAKIN